MLSRLRQDNILLLSAEETHKKRRDGARPAILQFYDSQSGQTALNVIRFHSDCTGRIAELQAWRHLLHRKRANCILHA